MTPMLGILGTVIGIIGAFHSIGLTMEDVSGVAGGISQALISTAFGLTVALITLITYNAFQAQGERSRDRIDVALSSLELALYEGEEKED